MSNNDKKPKEDKQNQPLMANNIPLSAPGDLKDLKIPEEVKKKLEKLKDELYKFKDSILKKFDKYILGITLLPPPMPQKLGEEKEKKEELKKDQINVLVVVDDTDSTTMSKLELKDKLSKVIEKSAEEINKNLKTEIKLLSELREDCYDGKYEVLRDIAVSAPVYDPKDLLAALRISELHKNMVLQRFDKYIVSYVAAGSLFRNEKSGDIDVYLIVDDTDVKRMPRIELKDRLGGIIRSMGAEASMITGIKKSFHIQVYILTDFWESVKEANPVIYTFLRDGVPLFDRGVFMPWKLLLEMGRIRPSQEAIDMQMDIGEKLLERVKARLLSIVSEDLYYAALNPTQAALMLYGVPPPTPKETVKLLEEIFVKKEKLLEKKYVDILERIRKYYKDVEHGKIKEVTGRDIDQFLSDIRDYFARLKKLFAEIEKKSEIKKIEEMYEGAISITKDVLRLEGKESENLIKDFENYLIKTNKIPEKYLQILKTIFKAKNEFKEGTIIKQEIQKVWVEASNYIRTLVEYVQRRRGYELERAKIRIKYGNKYGEVILLDNIVFITKDVDAKEKEIHKADITKEGGMGKITGCKLEEIEEHLAKAKIPKRVFLKEKIFEDIKSIFGKDVEILVSS
ncbi:hypothetical protein HY498_04385 [Candidatus Woesearchaeota archaeon]|nr:hypothetical protein [Candidatus Woesearchaeota archaeon]